MSKKLGGGNTEISSIYRKQLKAISKVNQVLPNTVDGLVVVPEIIQESRRITVDGSGSIIFMDTGFYRIQIQLNLLSSNNTNIETWAELWDGAAWQLVPDSGNVLDTAIVTETNFLIESTFIVPGDFMIRLKARITNGASQLNYRMLTNGIGTPSMTLIAYEL